MITFAPGCFFWPSFSKVSPGPNFAEFQKTRAGGLLGKFHIARLHGHLGSRNLQQNIVRGCHFEEILARTWWHSRQGVLSGLLFARVSPGPNFAEFQKMRAEGPLSKFNIAQLHGHLGSRGFQQNVVRGWHFKEMWAKTWWHSRQGLFLAFFLQKFPLVPTLQNFRKRALGVPLANST